MFDCWAWRGFGNWLCFGSGEQPDLAIWPFDLTRLLMGRNASCPHRNCPDVVSSKQERVNCSRAIYLSSSLEGRGKGFNTLLEVWVWAISVKNMSKSDRTPRDAPSLLHASTATFPEMPKRPDGQALVQATRTEEPSGTMAFFHKIKKGVENGLRPVPGMLKISRTTSEPEHQAQRSHDAAPMKGSLSDGHLSPPAPAPQPITSHTAATPNNSTKSRGLLLPPPVPSASAHKISPYRISQFEKLLSHDTVDSSQLKSLAWNGIPQVRITLYCCFVEYSNSF